VILLLTRLYRWWRARQPAGAPEGAPSAAVALPRVDSDRPSAAARGPLALLVHEARYALLAAWRNPRARFFTFIFPVLLLVVFAGVFGHGHTTTIEGHRVSVSTYFVGGILALSIISAAYGNLVMSVATARETGILKRRRATPVPAAILVAGQALATLAIAVVMTAILLLIARVAYSVAIPIGALAAMAVAVVVGAVSFACLGYAVAGMIGSPDSAQPVVQLTLLPLYFISGVWIPTASLSHGLRSVASVFPVEHLAASMHSATIYSSFSAAISPTDLLVLAAWGVGAVAFAARRFSWLPSAATA
jgi:ABC-2 type transport system permease protein